MLFCIVRGILLLKSVETLGPRIGHDGNEYSFIRGAGFAMDNGWRFWQMGLSEVVLMRNNKL